MLLTEYESIYLNRLCNIVHRNNIQGFLVNAMHFSGQIE